MLVSPPAEAVAAAWAGLRLGVYTGCLGLVPGTAAIVDPTAAGWHRSNSMGASSRLRFRTGVRMTIVSCVCVIRFSINK